MNPCPAVLLRLYGNAGDRLAGRPIHEAVVARARLCGLSGASVFTAEAGFGVHRVVHDSRSEYTFTDAPVVIELVDTPERVEALLAALMAEPGNRAMLTATINPVTVVACGITDEKPKGGPA
jgi:PII-like signaling protein